MIALDTNALIRLLTEDDPEQAKIVRDIILMAEENGIHIIVLSEVMIEIVWVLESLYGCSRDEIAMYLEKILSVNTFIFPDFTVLENAVGQYKVRGDFADLVIVHQARSHNADKLISFDKKLQKRFPDYVVEKITVSEILKE